jgi:hypothetical protein
LGRARYVGAYHKAPIPKPWLQGYTGIAR